MFSRLRRHMSYANVVATFALVFAMSGGALAASKFLITSTKQIKPSVLASLKGKAGANGAQGAAGAQGPAGPAGAKGENGAAGANGSAGTNGASVTSTPLGVGSEHCKEGGDEFVAASGASYACNGKAGKEGAKGATGEPWTPNNTLPSGATETGAWTLGGKLGVGIKEVSLSFPIKLKERLNNFSQNHFIFFREEAPAGCTGGTSENPIAEPGNLCVYANREASEFGELGLTFERFLYPSNFGGEGAGTTGVILGFESSTGTEERKNVGGTWAVTEK